MLFRIPAASSAMANLSADSNCTGRFSYEETFAYRLDRRYSYPESFMKADKQALRKRAKYILVKDAHLYYVGS